MSWNLEGLIVEATYLDQFAVSGKVELSRVKYGGTVSHHIVLETPIAIFGALRDRLIVDHKTVTCIRTR